MPNRILRESICTSEDVDGLSPEAEVFFYRLIVQADDYGRADGRPAILRARCFPLRMESVSESDIELWLAELAERGMVLRYDVDAKPYLSLTGWGKYQRTRADASKFPNPPADDSEPLTDDSEVQTPAAVVRSSVVGSRESKTRSERHPPAPDGAPVTNGKGKPFHLADVVNLGLVTSLTDRYRRRGWDKSVTAGYLTALVLGSDKKHIPAFGALAVNSAIDDLYANAATTTDPAGYLLKRAEAHASSSAGREGN